MPCVPRDDEAVTGVEFDGVLAVVGVEHRGGVSGDDEDQLVAVGMDFAAVGRALGHRVAADREALEPGGWAAGVGGEHRGAVVEHPNDRLVKAERLRCGHRAR